MSPPNENTPYQEPDPLAPLAHLSQWLVGATVHVVLGVLLGVFAARLMRRWHLHWSWAAGAFALVLLVRTMLAGDAATLGIAALGAAVRGRRWHGEDVQTGADLAVIAAERTTPFDGLRAGIHGVRSWLLSRDSAGWLGRWLANTRIAGGRGERLWRGSHLSVGVDRRGRSVAIELGGAEAGDTRLRRASPFRPAAHTPWWRVPRVPARRSPRRGSRWRQSPMGCRRSW